MSNWPPGSGHPWHPQTNQFMTPVQVPPMQSQTVPQMQAPMPMQAPPAPAPMPMGADPQLLKSLAETQQQMAELLALVKTASQYPAQWRAGLIEWPDRYAYPMVLTQELLASDGTTYGTTNTLCRATLTMDVSNPTYLKAISFNLWRPIVNNAPGLLGTYLPLGSTRQPFVAAAALGDYTGRDFRWQISTASDNMMWQTGWRTSDQCNSDDRGGYILPVEFELRRNDVVTIEVEPIGAVPDPAETFHLEVALHVYKMMVMQ